jgi:hypothetical protein
MDERQQTIKFRLSTPNIGINKEDLVEDENQEE